MSGDKWRHHIKEPQCVLHRNIIDFCIFKQFLSCPCPWGQKQCEGKSPLPWNFMYPCSYPSQNRNTLSLKITSCVGGSSPPPSSQVRKRQVVPCYHPAQPHSAKAKSEQTRMGNERSKCRTQSEICAMLVLISAIKYIFLCLHTLNSKVPKTAIAAWTSVVSATTSPVSTRQGEFWQPTVLSSSVLEKTCTFLGGIPWSSRQFPYCMAGGWTPLLGPSGRCGHSENDQYTLTNGLGLQSWRWSAMKPQKLAYKILFLGYVSLNSFHWSN